MERSEIVVRCRAFLAVLLFNSSKDILHLALLAPHLRRLALALNLIGINAARILYLNDCLPAVFIFHQKVGHISPLVLLAVSQSF